MNCNWHNLKAHQSTQNYVLWTSFLNFNSNLNLTCVSSKSVIQQLRSERLSGDIICVARFEQFSGTAQVLLLNFNCLCICSSTCFCRNLCLPRRPSDSLKNSLQHDFAYRQTIKSSWFYNDTIFPPLPTNSTAKPDQDTVLNLFSQCTEIPHFPKLLI